MKDKEKQRLKLQLGQLAEWLTTQEDEELLQSILSVCRAFLSMAEELMPRQSPEPVVKKIQAGYLGLSKRITAFYDKYPFGTEEPGVLNDLKEIQLSVQKKQEEAEGVRKSYEKAKAEAMELRERIDHYKEELASEEAAGERWRTLLSECTPEKIEEQRRENEKLEARLTEERGKLEKLQEDLKELKQEQERLNGGICETKAEIYKLPPKNAELRAEYRELEETLDNLRRAEVECSPERQQELRDEISILLPIVVKLQADKDDLANRLEDLQQQRTVYDKERQELSTNVIQILRDSAEGLEKVLEEHGGILRQTAETADKLAENLLLCQQLREEYKNWFDADESPLEAMIGAVRLQYPENEILRNTLDIRQVPSVEKLLGQTRDNLTTLDQIMAVCMDAAQEDLKRSREKAKLLKTRSE